MTRARPAAVLRAAEHDERRTAPPADLREAEDDEPQAPAADLRAAEDVERSPAWRRPARGRK